MALLMAACHKKDNKAPLRGTPDIEVAVPSVDSVVLHKSFPGVVQSGGSVDVVARTSGTLKERCFREGDYVSKGQVLFRLESTQYANAVQEAEAALNTARSQAEYYRNQHAAMQKALQADAVAKINVIQAESNLRQAEASIKDAQARLSDARTQLGYCTVTAPISGQISTAEYDVGSYIAGGVNATVLCHIVNNGDLRVVFNIDDAQYQNILGGSQQGMGNALFSNVPIKFSDIPGVTFTTSLFYSAPSVDISTGAITLEGRVNDPSHRLKEGMYAVVDLPTGTVPQAVLVKDASIGTDQLGSYLYVLNDSDKVVYRHIEPGQLYRDSLRIVTSGLKPGERYVTKALLTVRPGEKVHPVMAK